ncbi:MAG TPA: crossover junction endodeoxyribonuclease RuvC [Steroidobacteraceae bacterium]|nr:crossover junction endodeoxyribonuclease RuvC [Steroidobacteraceae bacterium]
MRTYRTRSWRAHRPAEASLVATVDTGGNGTTRVLGLDPGSRHTGYGIVDFTGPAATHIASGAIDTTAEEFSQRLQQIFAQVHELIVRYAPTEIAIERVFMHRNADSALKLGQARGAALCGAFAAAVQVFEYSPREIKVALVGKGGADKVQVQHMVCALLSLNGRINADAADALAVAICHAHGRSLRRLLGAR